MNLSMTVRPMVASHAARADEAVRELGSGRRFRPIMAISADFYPVKGERSANTIRFHGLLRQCRKNQRVL